MNIIYCSKDNLFSSNIIAAIHLKNIKNKNKITNEKLISLINNDNSKTKQKKLLFKGTDEFSNDIYILDVKKDCEILIKIINNYLKLHKVSKNDFVFVQSPKISTLKLIIGKYLINIGYHNAGKKLIATQIKNNFSTYQNLTKSVL